MRGISDGRRFSILRSVRLSFERMGSSFTTENNATRAFGIGLRAFKREAFSAYVVNVLSDTKQ